MFVNAILNLPIVRKFVENSNLQRGYELNDLVIFLPAFDNKNVFHQNILNQAKSETLDEKQILENYLEDCMINNTYYKIEESYTNKTSFIDNEEKGLTQGDENQLSKNKLNKVNKSKELT